MKPTQPTRPRLSVEEVMSQVQANLPALVPHMYLDGEWIWYCGPSLAGEQNKSTRETLKEIGFRFAFSGHVMRDSAGQPTSTVGSWGHSCQHPIPRKGKFKRAARDFGGEQVSEPQSQDLTSIL